MKHLICITTSKRDDLLIHCLNAIRNQFNDYQVLVFQDGEGDYSRSLELIKAMPHVWYKWEKPHGKEKFYIVHNEIFKICKKIDFELCHHIQDDCVIVPEYFEVVNNIFENTKIEVLNTLTLNCHRRNFMQQNEHYNFNGFGVYPLQRNDCNYVARPIFFKRLHWKQIPICSSYDFRNGSGVGSHTTIRYISNGGTVYNVLPSLLEHLGVSSAIGNKIDYNSVRSVLKGDIGYKDKQFEVMTKQKVGYNYHWL